MARWKLWVYGVVAVTGTAAVIVYALSIAPETKTRLDVALLLFTAAAAVTGYLGILIRLDRATPGSGASTKTRSCHRARGPARQAVGGRDRAAPPDPDVPAEVAEEWSKLERLIGQVEKLPAKTGGLAASLAAAWAFGGVNADDIADYRKRIEEYLREYEGYVKEQRLFGAFRVRSKQVILAFTNERAGVPAEGLRAILRVATGDDLHLLSPSDLPEEPTAPTRPKHPRPPSILAPPFVLPRPFLPSLDQTLGALRDIRPQGNVSPPIIRPGSTIIEFSVNEVLHNLHEDSRDHPIILLFNQAGSWTVPYEIHARNLPAPQRGALSIVARLKEEQAGSNAEGDSPTKDA